MKAKRFIVLLVALYLFFLLNHLMFSYVSSVRSAAQHAVTQVDEEGHALYSEILGDRYVLRPNSVLASYGQRAYYYTFFDAVYHWLKLRDDSNVMACDISSKLCSIFVYRVKDGGQAFMNLATNNHLLDEFSYQRYCIAGVDGFGKNLVSVGGDEVTPNFVFLTESSRYIISLRDKRDYLGLCAQ